MLQDFHLYSEVIFYSLSIIDLRRTPVLLKVFTAGQAHQMSEMKSRKLSFFLKEKIKILLLKKFRQQKLKKMFL